MSDMFLSLLIALGILMGLAAIVPMLHVCNSGCQRFFGRRRVAEPAETGKLRRHTQLDNVASSDRRSLSKVTLFS